MALLHKSNDDHTMLINVTTLNETIVDDERDDDDDTFDECQCDTDNSVPSVPSSPVKQTTSNIIYDMRQLNINIHKMKSTTNLMSKTTSAEPDMIPSKLKRHSSLASIQQMNDNTRFKSHINATSIQGIGGMSTTRATGNEVVCTGNVGVVTFDEKTSFTTGFQDQDVGAPHRSKRSSSGLFRRLSTLNLSGFLRTESFRARSNSGKAISFITSKYKGSESIEQQQQQQQQLSFPNIARSCTAPPMELSSYTSANGYVDLDKQKGNNYSNAESKRNETPILADASTIDRNSKSSNSCVMLDIKERYKIVHSEDTTYESLLNVLNSRVGNLEAARYILHISNILSAMVADGDEAIKRIKLSQTSFVSVQSKSITTILSEKLGFSPKSSQQKGINDGQNTKSFLSKTTSNFLDAVEISPVTHLFDGIKQPKISLDKYICRLVRYLNSFHEHDSSPDSAGIRAVMIATIYIDRLRDAHPNFILNSMNIHRLFLAATVLANKFVEDDHPTNEFMAGVGGVELKEINTLESRLCNSLSFQLFIKPEEVKEIYISYNRENPHTPAVPIGHGL